MLTVDPVRQPSEVFLAVGDLSSDRIPAGAIDVGVVLYRWCL